jgi:hypothetical protein
MNDPCDPALYPPDSLVDSVAELNSRTEWFHDPDRPPEEGPFVVVVDDFYSNPDEIRRTALSKPFFQYFTPTEDQVGAKASKFAGAEPCWFSTALVRYLGKDVRNPQMGYRYNPPELRHRFENLLNESVAADTWDSMGDYWNGAFHQLNTHWRGSGAAIHHHYRPGDVYPRGWSGVVYLSPHAPPWSGTSIWRHTDTDTCITSPGVRYYQGADVRDHFDLACLIENRYNRLALFRENILHRVETAFGMGNNARLTQTFFFQTERPRSGVTVSGSE